MADKPDPGKAPKRFSEQTRNSAARGREAQAAHNAPAQPHSRWQRVVRYVWGRSGRR